MSRVDLLLDARGLKERLRETENKRGKKLERLDLKMTAAKSERGKNPKESPNG